MHTRVFERGGNVQYTERVVEMRPHFGAGGNGRVAVLGKGKEEKKMWGEIRG